MNCSECGESFEQGNRLNRKYCGSTCQKKSERRRYKAKRKAAGTWNRGKKTGGSSRTGDIKGV